ncbi:MAG: HlyC/CorC family transporter [Deltaproteobacteria bacterium]|nr:HlyC/CorC family transporter [Deltaproteobacteria bacterium]
MSLEGLIIEAVIITVLILLNGFFSGAEIAIISAKRSVIEKLAKEGNLSAQAVSRMKEAPDRFLATVQVGVTVVGTLASVIGGVTAAEFLKPVFLSIPVGIIQESAEFFAVGVVVIVISYATLVLGELVPKTLALRFSERIACFSARPITLLSKVSALVVGLLTASTGAVVSLLGVKGTEKKVFFSEEEIKYMIKEGRAAGALEEAEVDLLHGVFEFADTTVREVMVPKHKITAIDIDTPFSEAMKIIAETGFSRYPVYIESIENVAGILFNKDVFNAMEKGVKAEMPDLMRTPYFVPNSIMISRLLREMQRRKVHMAIVVDEHGGVDGLVTIEDILEEIVGEIEDEYDVGKGGLVEKLKDGTLVIDASASLRDLEDVGIVIKEEDMEEFHTLAGFMLAKLQRIPRGGEFVTYQNRRFTVVDVESNRIVKVKVEPIETAGKVARVGA